MIFPCEGDGCNDVATHTVETCARLAKDKYGAAVVKKLCPSCTTKALTFPSDATNVPLVTATVGVA